MWREIFLFEIRYHLRQPLFYVTGLSMFLLGAAAISSGLAVEIRGLPGVVNQNAPLVILRLMGGLTAVGLFVLTAFVASSLLRDFRLGTHMLFFSRPVRKSEYLMGRFAGSMVVSLALLVIAILGVAAGSAAPWQDAERVGPFTPAPYLYGLLIIVLPNLLMMGGVFFAVACLTRSMLATYVCVVVFVILQDEAETLIRDVEHALAGSLIEPLGIAALDNAARYWTVAEYNTALPGLAGDLLANRLVWVVVGLLFLAVGYARFDYSTATAPRRWPWRRTTEADGSPVHRTAPGVMDAAQTRRFSPSTSFQQLLREARLQIAHTVRSVPFLVLLILGLAFVLFVAHESGQIRGTPLYPATYLMLGSVESGMALFLLIVLAVYAGELVWRQRSLGLSEVYDALPVPDWVFLGAKVLTLAAVVAIFMLGGALVTIAYQLSAGFTEQRPGLYLEGLLIAGWPFLLLGVMALFLQNAANHKLLGYLLVVLLILARAAMPFLGLEHNLLRYPGATNVPYSDMNGWGHHLEPYLWGKLYWSLGALLLLSLSGFLLVRGTESSLRSRLAAARRRCRGPLPFVAAFALVGFSASGAFIFYNTNVLNTYVPKRRAEALRAEYEKRYRQYLDLPQPRLREVSADVDIFPSERRVEIRGAYTLENGTGLPIPSLHLVIDPQVRVNRIDPGRENRLTADPEHGYYILEFAEPIAPGDRPRLLFDLSVVNPGFAEQPRNNLVVANGTFFNNHQYFPSIGYSASNQLEDPALRRRHGLGPVPRMAKIDDQAARSRNSVTRDADWIRFETIVSTRADQIAIAPGRLEREWAEGARRYFHYRMDGPMLGFFCYVSADYAVRRDRWNDVAIEVYHDRRHPYNVGRMIDAVKKSLDYYTGAFGPYQHREIRIVEFPAYARFAQAFPGTIPFSEGAGFLARVDPRSDIDYVYNTTAHEVAHQWWAHQVIGADLQGSTLLDEGLSEYSSLMVMEKQYGRERMRRFLRYEMDGYLRGRGREVVEETPLMLVEGQPYIHYNKGSLILYALRDYIGEEGMNRALARFLRQYAFQGPPYPTAIDLLDTIRPAIPAGLEYLIEDFFETITVHANRALGATCTPLGDGRFKVDLEVEARKMRADGQGHETEIDIDDWIDIGVFGEESAGGVRAEKELFLEKRRIQRARTTFQIVVEGRPVRAGIDPYNKMIDRQPGDNLVKVSEAPSPR